MNLWTATDIVVAGDNVAATYPGTWETLTQPEELTYVDGTTLRISNTDSFSAEDELVKFNLKDGKVESVNYSGSTLWPEEVWLKRLAGKNSIDLADS